MPHKPVPLSPTKVSSPCVKPPDKVLLPSACGTGRIPEKTTVEVLLLIFSTNLSCRTSNLPLPISLVPTWTMNTGSPPALARSLFNLVQSFSWAQTMRSTPLIIEYHYHHLPFPRWCGHWGGSSILPFKGTGQGPIPARAGIGWTPPPLEMSPLCGVHALSFACTLLSPNSLPACSEVLPLPTLVPSRTCYKVPGTLPILSYPRIDSLVKLTTVTDKRFPEYFPAERSFCTPRIALATDFLSFIYFFWSPPPSLNYTFTA